MTTPFRKTSRSSLLCCLIAALIVFALASSVAAFAAVNGAIYTTTSTGTKVNGNLYGAKTDVYLNGGPQNTSDPGLTPGNGSTPAYYYFQVTDPSGAMLLSADDISCRQVVVQNGRIIGVPSAQESPYGTPPSTQSTGCDHPVGILSPAALPPNNEEPVQLCPATTRTGDNLVNGQFYDPNNWCDTTSNPGGEYKAWLTPVADYVGIGVACPSGHGNNVWGFCDQDSKTDNFKVQPAPPPPPCPDPTNPVCQNPPPPSANLVACKYWDKDDDGFNDNSDSLLGGWTITASTTDATLVINGGTPGASASGTTASSGVSLGCTTFTITGFPDATTPESVTLTETQQTNWNQVAPLSGPTGSLTYTGGTGGSITVTGNCVADSVTGLVAPCTSTSSVPLIGDGSTTAAPDFGNTGLDLTVSKTATPAFTRTYSWSISKKVDKTLIETTGTTATFNYEVDVNETGFLDSAWQVSGTITVTNPNSFAVTGVNVTDVVDDGGSCTITDANAGNDTVPAGGSLNLPYVCTYGSAPTYNVTAHNTATATWIAATFNTKDSSASYQAAFVFDDGTAGNPTLVNKTVTPTDSFNGGSAVNLCTLAASTPCTLTASDTTPYTSQAYKYSRSITVKPGCFTYNNTATVVQDTLPYPTASASVEVCGPAATGALTMGFWQNKNGQGIIAGGASTSGVCNSGTWLRQFAPFQDLSATAPCGKVGSTSNSDVVGYVYNVIKVATCTSTSKTCNTMLKAQMLATALDVYFSDPTLGGNKISAPAPIGPVKIDLTKVCSMIDGSGGTATCSGTFLNCSSAFNSATCLDVLHILAYAGSQSNSGGSTWYANVKATQVLAKNVFDAINNKVAFNCP